MKRLAAAAMETAESDKVRCESLTHLARAHHATGELEAAFKYYRQVRCLLGGAPRLFILRSIGRKSQTPSYLGPWGAA